MSSIPTTFLEVDDVLWEEARTIHGNDIPVPKELYKGLYDLNSAALCFSGGGIRSAAFCLGFMQALAETSTNQGDGKEPPTALLAQFHYLSTVSGGGYIGSWLSAWRRNTSLNDIIKALSARGRADFPQLAWLRAFSNYLTPKVGLFSLDTWTATTLWIRNLLLNWSVVLPPACVVILFQKLIGLVSVWIIEWDMGGEAKPRWDGSDGSIFYAKWMIEVVVSPVAAATFLAFAIIFLSAQRPGSRTSSNGGPTEKTVLICYVLPSLLSAFFLTELCASEWAGNYFLACAESTSRLPWPITGKYCDGRLAKITGDFNVARYPLWYYLISSAAIGASLYFLAYQSGRLWLFLRGCVNYHNSDSRDGWSWCLSGAVYGALVGLSFYVYLIIPDEGLPIVQNSSTRLPVYFIHLVFMVPWILISQLLAEMVFLGASSRQDGSDSDREWFARAGGWLLAIAVSWFLFTFLLYFSEIVKFFFFKTGESGDKINEISKAATSIAAISGLLAALFGSSRIQPKPGSARSWPSRAIDVALPVFAVVFAGASIVALSQGLDLLLFGGALIDVTPAQLSDFKWGYRFTAVVVAMVLFSAVAALASASININRFSLHAMYRNRLINAFLGASNTKRNPDAFTGFDAADNPTMTSLAASQSGGKGLFHILNLTLNAVATRNLAWQERKAEAFTVSPLHCGSANEGYRPSSEYGGQITLGTAMAISGAAASPNMGYQSSPAITFLLTLFNVRLGWWLGNPGPSGDSVYKTQGPNIALAPMIREAAGLTTDNGKYVYLSDGGHFDNLGLYEMVRRRCRFIVVIDAGRDQNYNFEDLSNACRKVEIDFGKTIRFDRLYALKPRKDDCPTLNDAPYHALGSIAYSDQDLGQILYIKPGYYGVEGTSIVGYANAHLDFPHQSTLNQWFSESQFESYRALGQEIGSLLVKRAAQGAGDKGPLTIRALFSGLQVGAA